MSCATCEVTPPNGRGGPDRIHHGHIGHAFGDVMTIGTAVLYRGHDVTLQTVEALAGDEHSGWVEMRIMNGDGQPTIHPAAMAVCPDCDTQRQNDPGNEPPCPYCLSPKPGTIAYGPHPYTVIRQGHVQIIQGTRVINGTTD